MEAVWQYDYATNDFMLYACMRCIIANTHDYRAIIIGLCVWRQWWRVYPQFNDVTDIIDSQIDVKYVILFNFFLGGVLLQFYVSLDGFFLYTLW